MKEFKVMVTGSATGIIWDIVSEDEVPENHFLYRRLSEEIDLLEWKNRYIKLYKSWLDDDDGRIYDIADPINMDIINALIKLNERYNDTKLYYWFDVNRERYEGYTWSICPLSNSQLITLPEVSHENNRKISPVFPLIFPD